jgi:prepilin-type processing-associated H-X9-DG protein
LGVLSSPWGPGGQADAPHHQLWPNYLSAEDVFICPSDPAPGDFSWWELGPDDFPNSDRPDQFEDASYGASEHGMAGNYDGAGGGHLKSVIIDDPQRWGWMADAWILPNGWEWEGGDTVPPGDWGQPRVTWTHSGNRNFAFGDGHAAAMPMKPNIEEEGFANGVFSNPRDPGEGQRRK